MTRGADNTTERTSLPAGTGGAALIVCERTGRWAVALRRELADAAVRFHETRSLAEAWDVLRRCPTSVVVVELTPANADALLARLATMEREYPLARVMVVSQRKLLRYQWLLREAGVVGLAVSVRELTPLARVVVRHLEQVPLPRLSLAEQVWAELPWGRANA